MLTALGRRIRCFSWTFVAKRICKLVHLNPSPNVKEQYQMCLHITVAGGVFWPQPAMHLGVMLAGVHVQDYHLNPDSRIYCKQTAKSGNSVGVDDD